MNTFKKRKSSDFSELTEQFESLSEPVVFSALTAMRLSMNKHKNSSIYVDEKVFKIITGLLKSSNLSIVNLAVSIVANVCLNDVYRRIFLEVRGVEYLVAVIRRQYFLLVQRAMKESNEEEKSNEISCLMDEQLVCRIWRLAANLAISFQLCSELMKRGLAILMHDYMGFAKYLSQDTFQMLGRAIRKCWAHRTFRSRVASKEMVNSLTSCLKVENELFLVTSMELLRAMAPSKVDRDMLLLLASLHNQNKLSPLPLKTLACLMRSATDVGCVEGTGVPLIFINHIQCSTSIEKVVLEGLCALCREGAVRNLIRNEGALDVLINLCSGSSVTVTSPSLLISTFLLFQYDQPSMKLMSENSGFVDFVMQHSEVPASIKLAQKLAQFSVPELVNSKHIDIMIRERHCQPLLVTVGKCTLYFETLVLSGRAWELAEAGCRLHEVGMTGHGEGVIAHHLGNKTAKERRRTVALAVPFLITAENKKLLFKLLLQYEGLSEILTALNERPTDSSIIAAVVQLASILPTEFCIPEEEQMMNITTHQEPERRGQSTVGTSANVEFELEGGGCVVASRELMCQKSPVIDAMLNGHFAEAGKSNVNLPGCTRSALTALISLLSERTQPEGLQLDVTTHLQLIALTDRLLIAEPLGRNLTRSLIELSGDKCAASAVYVWCLSAGHSPNATRLRAWAYSTLLTKKTALAVALANPESRQPLIQDITDLFNDCLLNL